MRFMIYYKGWGNYAQEEIMTLEKTTPTVKLNKIGDTRGMHPNSLVNLEKRVSWQPGESGNPTGYSITQRFRQMMLEKCPFDSKQRTWLESLSEAGLRQALTQPIALREILDRLEGKVTQPITGEDGGPILVDLLGRLRGRTPGLVASGEKEDV